MDKNKNIQTGHESDLDQPDLDKINLNSEDDLPVPNTKEGDLKPANKISGNIHIKPADEQQFENDN